MSGLKASSAQKEEPEEEERGPGPRKHNSISNCSTDSGCTGGGEEVRKTSAPTYLETLGAKRAEELIFGCTGRRCALGDVAPLSFSRSEQAGSTSADRRVGSHGTPWVRLMTWGSDRIDR